MSDEKTPRKKSTWNMALSEWSKKNPGKKFGSKGSDSYNEIKAIEAKLKASSETKPVEIKEKKTRGRKPKSETTKEKTEKNDDMLILGEEVPISHVVPLMRVHKSVLENKIAL